MFLVYKNRTDRIKYERNKNVNVQQAHLKLSEECHVSTDTVFLTASTRVSHIVLLCCVFMEAEDSVRQEIHSLYEPL